MEIVRTVKLKLDMPQAQAKATQAAWTDACNAVSAISFENGAVSNAVKLHGLAYDKARSFGLSAQVAQSCIRHVASKYATMRKNKITPKRPCSFRGQAVILQGGARGRDVALRRSGLSLWTTAGRAKSVPWHGPGYMADYLDTDVWSFGDGRLFVAKGKVYLTLSFKKEVDDKEGPADSVVGVDRGINVLACATDGDRVLLRKGGYIKHIRDRMLRTRSSLQRKKAERRTRSVAKTLKRLSGRERRFMRSINHVISRRIVDFAVEAGFPVIAVEDLDGVRRGRLRKPQRKEVHRWAYGELVDLITYKAAEHGIAVVRVEARNTSKGCSRCGHTQASNRRGHRFKCKACGLELHADLNAARNIRQRGILARQVLGEDGPPSTGPEVLSGEDVSSRSLRTNPDHSLRLGEGS